VVLLVAAVAVAWLGLLAHNQLSLPLAPLSAENLGPLLVYAVLAAWYVRSRGGGTARAALAGWALLNFGVGGVLTVLPLPILPFAPEQTLAHYVAHVVYSVAQLPLLAILARPRSSSDATRTSSVPAGSRSSR
jgi:hypothetical protein